jgi:hypothetical protein
MQVMFRYILSVQLKHKVLYSVLGLDSFSFNEEEHMKPR